MDWPASGDGGGAGKICIVLTLKREWKVKMEQKAVFCQRERVRWIDTDSSQRIHFTAMFRFFEIAEQEFLRSIGFTYTSLKELGVGLPRVGAQCNYRAIIMHDEMLDIEVRVERVGNSSVTLSYIARRQDRVVGADGQATFCAVDNHTGHSTPLPEKLRQALLFAEHG